MPPGPSVALVRPDSKSKAGVRGHNVICGEGKICSKLMYHGPSARRPGVARSLCVVDVCAVKGSHQHMQSH